MSKVDYNTDQIEQITEKIRIKDILEENGHTTRGNRNIRCPFHSDNKPSFSFYYNNHIQGDWFTCFGCGVKGTVIHLHAKFHNLSYGKAKDQLAERIGLSNRKTMPIKIKREYAQNRKERTVEEKFLNDYLQIYLELCSYRHFLQRCAENHKSYYILKADDLVIEYYHDKAYIEFLLDGLLDGLQEKISVRDQIDFFLKAKGVVAKWQTQFITHSQLIQN